MDSDASLFQKDRNFDFQRGDILIYHFQDVLLWPQSGAVSNSAHDLLECSLFDSAVCNTAIKSRLLGNFPVYGKKFDYACTLGHVYGNYFHRNIDCIPRIFSLWHPRYREIAHIDILICKGQFTDAELNFVASLIPKNCSIYIVPALNTRVHISNYIHLPFLSARRTPQFRWWENCAGYLPQEYLTFLRSHAAKHFRLDYSSTPQRKIYVSRRDATIRRLENEESVIKTLSEYGFDILHLNGATLEGQARLFSQAAIVLTQHGAALTNLLYAHPSSRVIEILSNAPCKIYESLAIALGLEYTPIVCKGKTKNSDVHLSIDTLKLTLKNAGAL